MITSPLYFLKDVEPHYGVIFGWATFSSVAADVWRSAGLPVDVEPSDEIDHETAAEVAQNDMRCDASCWRERAAQARREATT